MYKIIIVDETEVCGASLVKIDFNTLGFDLVNKAENGIEA